MKFNQALTCSLFLFVTILSCKTNNTADKKTDLYYFPEKNIYYDLRTTAYYYSLDSAKTWDSLVYKKGDYGSALGEKIGVARTGRYPWTNNDSDRKVYNGVVLNIVNSRSLYLVRLDSIVRVRKQVEAEIAKARTAATDSVVEVKEPEKKGLKKFFNNLFGKKKKDEEKKEE